ncbi:MAG: type II toxin-antitoxin system RelE/ParE family toxin [Acidobacteriota bacterium]
MTLRRVRFTATAQEHVRREKAWWLENRIYAKVFATELEAALRILTILPGAGTPYAEAGIEGLRRLYLPKIACHLYYTFDEHEVIIRALWGARRGRGPQIDS